MGFTRRFSSWPGDEVITQIEGVNIIDLDQPGQIEGQPTGVCCLVGEFPDMTYACTVSSTGAVSTLCRPQQVFSAADILEKVGGWDPTIGNFGKSNGNGYAAFHGLSFSALVLAPVNLASNRGARFFRELPMCTSQTNTTPVVPTAGAVIEAGREFRNGAARMLIAKRCVFTALDVLSSGTNGTTVAGVSAATQVFNADVGFDWTLVDRGDGTLGAKKGDVVVIGYNNAGAKAPSAEAGTYRVASDPVSGVAVTLERLDGASFAFTAQTNVPWRLHFSSDADTAPVIVSGSTTPGGYAAADAGGYVVPVRPLTDATGANVDGNWAAATLLTPRSVPTAATGSSWDPLSSLGGRTHSTDVTPYTKNVQQPNAVAHSSLDALYTTAFDATIGEPDPVSSINVIWSARTSQTIRAKIKSNALAASKVGIGRMGVVSPTLDIVSPTDAGASASPGVGATSDESVIYAWPGYQGFVQDAVGTRIKTADGLTTVDGVLDLPSDSLLASLLSKLPPERNPGQTTDPVPQVLSVVRAIQRGVATLTMDHYIYLKGRGIMALRIDKDTGPEFQSGVTSSTVAGKKNVYRRRMANFIQDTLAKIGKPFAKQPSSVRNNDDLVSEVVAFYEELLSKNNSSLQRIDAYSVDEKSGNTTALRNKGVFVIVTKCKLTPTKDFIVFMTQIGENMVINTEIDSNAV